MKCPTCGAATLLARHPDGTERLLDQRPLLDDEVTWPAARSLFVLDRPPDPAGLYRRAMTPADPRLHAPHRTPAGQLVPTHAFYRLHRCGWR